MQFNPAFVDTNTCKVYFVLDKKVIQGTKQSLKPIHYISHAVYTHTEDT